MPRDAVSRTANVERNGGHKYVICFGQYQLLFAEANEDRTVASKVNYMKIKFRNVYLNDIQNAYINFRVNDGIDDIDVCQCVQ